MKTVVTRPDGTKISAIYVEAERNSHGLLVAKGVLKHGLKIGEDRHREFTLKEALTGDLLRAERIVDSSKPMNFSNALLAQQLVKLGTFDGVITPGMLEALRPEDWNKLREAQTELDLLGEVIE